MSPLNNSRGQVALLYALVVPILLFMGGVGLDLGWYYLNVSRLQNAADAAVLVGANKLIEEHDTFKNKNYKARLVDKYPASSPAYDTTDNLTKSASGKLIDTKIGDEAALDYAKKNLAGSDMGYALPSLFSVAHAEDDTINSYAFKDSYTRGDPTVTLTPSLWQDGDGNYYYVLHLTERIHHFFVGFLGDMESPVVAVALITKNNSGSGGGNSNGDNPTELALNFDTNGGKFDDESTADSKTIKSASAMEDDEVVSITPDKGTPTKTGKIFKGWSTSPTPNEDGTVDNFIADGKQLTKTELQALFGDSTEVTLFAVWVDDSSSSDSSSGSGSSSSSDTPTVKPKPHNNRTLWEQMHYLIAKYVYDPNWDVSVQKYGRVGQTAKIVHNSFDTIDKTYISNYHYYTELINLETSVTNSSNVGNEIRYFIDFRRNDWLSVYRGWYYNDTNSRTHSLFNVNKAYAVRSGYNDDPLYLRIEAEPGNDYTEPGTKNGTNAYYFTPVRQIVININADNMADNLRPLFFYYDGPDAVKSHNAAPQPVILNLNADFKGVLWMPDVPVVINGNGHTFEGFIVASEFRYLDRRNGSKVNYSSNGKTVTNASDNKIRVNTSNGDVYSIKVDDTNAYDTYENNKGTDRFNLSSESKFRTFTVDKGVKYNYIFYDSELQMDSSPFYLNDGSLIPLYKLDNNGKQVRVTKWDDVNLYDNPRTVSSRQLIPKQITGNKNIRTVRLDSDGNPSPLYDEAGNPVYFCEDYVNLTGTYEVFTLDRVADGTRDPKEFLLTKTDALNVPNTDDWK